ncbi:MAG: capsular biosynthesis protein [Firmicutes bacterium]|nr:capsular biosynthesis protein [Bacillota bacterium]
MEEEIDLRQWGHILVARWRMIALITVVVTLLSGMVTVFLITPKYTATGTVLVNSTTQPNTPMYNDVQASQQLANTYAQIMQSDRVLHQALHEANSTLSTEDLRKELKVEAVAQTQVIQLSVTSTSPESAAALANGVLTAFTDIIPTLMKIDNVHIVDKAVPPANPSSPNLKLNLVIAFVLGLLFSIGIAFLLNALDEGIHSEDDLEQVSGLPVLGVISLIEAQDLRSAGGESR